MNKIYKVIFNRTRQVYQVVSELANGHAKTASPSRTHRTRKMAARLCACQLILGAAVLGAAVPAAASPYYTASNLTGTTSVTAGTGATTKVTIGDSGVKIGTATYISSSGLNANGLAITDVLAGSVSSTSTDAVNGKQLYTLQTTENAVLSNIASALSTTYNASTGTFAAPAYTITKADGTTVLHTENNVGAALTDLNKLIYTSVDSATKYFKANSSMTTGGADNAPIALDNADASDTNAIAVGSSSVSNGNDDIAIGDNASVGNPKDTKGATNAIAIGGSSKVTGSSSVALGESATVSGASSLALGVSASTSGSNAVSLGSSAAATADRSLALGTSSAANGGSSLAIGASAYTSGSNDISMGNGAGVSSAGGNTAGTQQNRISIGTNAGTGVTGNEDTAIGLNAGDNVTGDWNVAIGTSAGTGVGGNYNTAIGYKANSSGTAGNDSTAIGASTSASTDGTALGYSATAGTNSVSIGSQSSAAGNGVAIGTGAKSSDESIAIGYGSTAASSDSTGLGYITESPANSNGVFSVGFTSTGLTRRIVNVADGSAATDAVNVEQLQAAQKSVATLVGGGVSLNTATGQYTGGITVTDAKQVQHNYATVAEAIDQLTTGGITIAAPGYIAYTDNSYSKVELSGASGTVIGNVGDAVAAKDAVNLETAQKLVLDNKIKYFSVNSTRSGNEGDNSASGTDAIAVGGDTSAVGTSSIAVGTGASSKGNYSIAIGNAVKSSDQQAIAYDQSGIAIGTSASSNGTNSIALGTDALTVAQNGVGATVNDAIAIGVSANATNDDAIAFGLNAVASGKDSLAEGTSSKSSGTESVAIGDNANSGGSSTVALGTSSAAGGTNALALGTSTNVSGLNVFSLGEGGMVTADANNAASADSGLISAPLSSTGSITTLEATDTYAIGNGNGIIRAAGSQILGNSNTIGALDTISSINYISHLTNSSVIGDSNTAVATNSSIIGSGNTMGIDTSSSTAYGYNIVANSGILGNNNTIQSGSTSSAGGNYIVGNGNTIGDPSSYNTIIGGDGSKGTGNTLSGTSTENIVLGYDNGLGLNLTANQIMATNGTVNGNTFDGILIGTGGTLGATSAIAIGTKVSATNTNAIAIGTGDNVSGISSGAIGDPTTVSGNYSYAVGNGNTVAQDNDFVFGNGITTNYANEVVLGNLSKDTSVDHPSGYTRVTQATVGTKTYTGFAGSSPVGLVSVGSAGGERQIINVAAGAIDAASTDAINGSELYAVASELDTAVIAAKTTVSGDSNVKVTPSTAMDGHINYAVSLNNIVTIGTDTTTAITINGDTSTITDGTISINGANGNNASSLTAADTITGLSNTTWNGTSTPGYSAGRAATEGELYEATSGVSGGLYFGANDETASNGSAIHKSLGDTLNIVGGYTGTDTSAENVKTVTTKGGDIQVQLSENPNFTSVTTTDGNGNTTVTSGTGVKATSSSGTTTLSSTGVTTTDSSGNTTTVSGNGITIKGAGASGKTVTIDSDNVNMGGNQIHNIAPGTAGTDAVDVDQLNSAVAGATTTVSAGDNNVKVTSSTAKDGHTDYAVSLEPSITLGTMPADEVTINGNAGTITAGTGSSAVTLNGTTGTATVGNVTINGGGSTGTVNGLTNKTWNPNSITSGQAATEDQLKVVDKETVHYDTNSDGTVNYNKVTMGNGTGETTITNVAPGTISATSTDAVNGSQLYGVEQTVINQGNAINTLGNRINKVGANAAALSALHPLDFDPDDKWDFAAGYGHYRSANAASIGAFYRPNEDTMFSIGASTGGGDNMFNAGVTLKLGQGNHISTSRVAMAKEIIDLNNQVKELTALVHSMLGTISPIDPSKSAAFPDVPANHWAYEYVSKLAGNGILKGYPDGTFQGDRTMTRYEFAAMLYRAMQNGAAIDGRLLKEFKPELDRIRVDETAGNIDRVHVIPGRG